MSIFLEEATFDQIFKELIARYPNGVLLCFLKNPEGEEDEEDDVEDHVSVAFHRVYPSIGLARVAVKIMEKNAVKDITRRELDEDEEFEEEEDE